MNTLKRWTTPSNYFGASWPEYFSAGVGQSRDSSAIERANFSAMLKALGGETGEDDNGISGVVVVRESHWAVGWVEWIAIHESNSTALEIASEIQANLENYPIIDESLFSEYEDEECRETWQNCYDAQERAEYLRRHIGKVYPMSGETAYTMLRAAVKGSWYHAANLLPCPSDLIA